MYWLALCRVGGEGCATRAGVGWKGVGWKAVACLLVRAWQTLRTEQLDREMSSDVDLIEWTRDGCILSVSSANGCLYNYRLNLASLGGSKSLGATSLLRQLTSPLSPLEVCIASVRIPFFSVFRFAPHLRTVPFYFYAERLLQLTCHCA